MSAHINPHGPREQRVACPHCSKSQRDTTLGVNVTTGVFHCFRCGVRGKGDTVSGAGQVIRMEDPALPAKRRERLARVWSESVAMTAPTAAPVRQYLHARGLDRVIDTSVSLRAHAGLAYFDGMQKIGTFPAMVAQFCDPAGAMVTLHVTYVSGGRKAPVTSPKKLMGVPVRGGTRGGAIRLQEPRDGVLGIAEGIETALSLSLLRGIPVWASYCAAGLERVRLPAGLRELYVAPDIDENNVGQSAAQKLIARVQRWRNKPRIFLVTPPGDGPRDLNDSLKVSA